MPRADFSLVHMAATQRFGTYADLIFDLVDAETVEQMEDANLSLMTALDENLKVERGAFERSLAGIEIGLGLGDYIVRVRDAINSVRGTF